MTRHVALLLAVGLLAGSTGCAGNVSGHGTQEPSRSSTTGSSSASSSPTRPSTSGTSGHSLPGTRTRTSTTPVPGLPSWLLGEDWDRIPTSVHNVALTFDAGGDAAGVAPILATLAREHVRATFFLTGSWVQTYPAQARAICAAHRVGDHSVTHPRSTRLSSAQLREEVLDAATAVRQTCGVDPAPLFRFPYGDRDARTIGVVNSLGYVPVSWTVDTLGWEGTRKGISTRSVIARVLSALRPGEIVLMHVGANPDDRSTLDADALPDMIRALRSRGYGFVTLDALLTAE